MCQRCVSRPFVPRLIPSRAAAWNKRRFGSGGELDMWAVPSRRRLTSRQVAVMATCRDLSKLALRRAPGERPLNRQLARQQAPDGLQRRGGKVRA